MNYSTSKYYYDIYLYEKLLTEEQIGELKKLERDIPNLLFKLRTFLVSKTVNERYQEYFNGKNTRGNVFLKNLELNSTTVNLIMDEQKYHAKLLHISNFISQKGFEKLTTLIDRKIIKRLDEVFTEAASYYSNQSVMTSNKSKLELAVEKGVLKSMPPKNEIFDDFDMLPFYHHAKIFQTQNYVEENGDKNIIQFLKDIISFLPNNEIFGKISVDIKDDGRDMYYYIQRDVMITVEANGIPYSVRSEINSKKYEGTYRTEFNERNGLWQFSQGADIFNKIYREIGSDNRLFIISDLPKAYSHPIGNDSKIGILVTHKSGDPLRQDGIGFLGFNSKNKIDPNQSFTEKDFTDFLDKMNEADLFHLYSNEEIKHVSHLAKTKFLHAPNRSLWLFDFFAMAICVRESDSYKNFVELVPKLTHGKVLLENFHEDIEKGEFGFSLNGTSYFTNDLLKGRVDPYFILLINNAMAEQDLDAFYFWNNEFDPHEQFCVIYSNSEIVTKANAASYFQFMDLDEDTIRHWRE